MESSDLQQLSSLYDTVYTSEGWREVEEFVQTNKCPEAIGKQLNTWHDQTPRVQKFYTQLAANRSADTIIQEAQAQAECQESTLILNEYRGQFTQLPMLKLLTLSYVGSCKIVNSKDLTYLQAADIVTPELIVENCPNITLSPHFFDCIQPVRDDKNNLVLPHITIKNCPHITGTTTGNFDEIRIENNAIDLLEKTHQYFAVLISKEKPDWKFFYIKKEYLFGKKHLIDERYLNTPVKDWNCDQAQGKEHAINTTYHVYKKPFAFAYLKHLYLLWEYLTRWYFPNLYFPCKKICSFTTQSTSIFYQPTIEETRDDGTTIILQ